MIHEKKSVLSEIMIDVQIPNVNFTRSVKKWQERLELVYKVLIKSEKAIIFILIKKVKRWYDGFIFGSHKDMYNPWSILNFLDTGTVTTYWANTSGNSLVGKLIREGSRTIKYTFEQLLHGNSIRRPIDEQIVYNQLRGNEDAVWSLLIASGYLKVLSVERYEEIQDENRVPQLWICV